jgi:hypothetical protein
VTNARRRRAGRLPLAGTTTPRWAGVLLLAAFAIAAIYLAMVARDRELLSVKEEPRGWWSYPAWVLTAVLEGVLLATYVRAGGATRATTGQATTGGVLSFLAVSCPVCNKLVVLAVGASGALSYWVPVQPFLAAASAALLAFAVYQRLRGMRRCPVRAGPRR